MIYGEKLRFLREEKEITQIEISKLLGFHNNVYGQFEREETIIPIKHLNFLCNYFNCSIDYIFNFSNIRKYNSLKESINLKISGERIKEFRKEKNITQKQLADNLKTDNSTISKYERSLYPIATPYLYNICKKNRISADYLLGKTNIKYIQNS